MQSEESILAQLRKLVDNTAEQLRWGKLHLPEAIELVAETREQAEKLIPNMMDTYDLIYESRFTRLMWQFVLPKQEIQTRVPIRAVNTDIR